MVSGSERPCYEHNHFMSIMLVLAFNLLKYHCCCLPLLLYLCELASTFKVLTWHVMPVSGEAVMELELHNASQSRPCPHQCPCEMESYYIVFPLPCSYIVVLEAPIMSTK
jgi:hypothetical protein